MEAPLSQVAAGDLRARVEAGRAEMARALTARPCGRDASAAFSDLYDQIVGQLWRAILADCAGVDPRSLALVATGGWGRREMCPYSDIDFILLTAKKVSEETARQVSDRLLYPLWDAGIKVVPSLDAVETRARLARSDLPTATGLLDARHIAGNRALSDALARASRRHVAPSGNANKLIERLASDKLRRHDKFGDSLYLLEPDLKNGIGALRDLCTAMWAVKARWAVDDPHQTVTMGLVSARQVEVLESARDFFLALRSLVQLEAGRATDRLTFEVQEAIATKVYSDAVLPKSDNRPDIRPAVAPAVEALMQRFYVHARAVVQVTDRMLEATRVPARRKPRIYRIDSTFLSWNGKLAVRDPEILREQPSEMYRLFRVALDRDLPIYGHTKELIAENMQSPAIAANIAGDPTCSRWFLEALIDPRDRRQPSLLEQMHELGLLSAIMPEFAPCTCRVQHDLYHVYTVDQHQLYTVAMLKKLERRELAKAHPTATDAMGWIEARQGLYLGTLLHDVGKPMGKGHAEKGAQLTKVIAERLGMAKEQAQLAEFLVRQHLTMSHLSQRRDLSDPDVISRFAGKVGTEDRLASLYLCTLCDTAMTAPGNLSAWKNELLNELFLRTWAQLRGEAPATQRDAAAEAEKARQRLVELLCPKSEPGIEADEQVREQARKGAATLVARIDDRFFNALTPRQLSRQARLVWKHRESDSPVEIAVACYPLKGHSELAIVTLDARGLLAAIAGALAANRIDVLGAVIGALRPRSELARLDPGATERAASTTTATPATLDLFYVRDLYGKAIPADDPRWERFRSDLSELVATDSISGEAVEALMAKRRPKSGLAPRVTPGVATKITIDNDSSADATVIEVVTRDEVGVLFAITHTLTELGLDIHVSRVATEGERVADSFYVTHGETRQKLLNPELAAELKRRLYAALSSVSTS